MRRWGMFWGLVLITVGALLLLDNLGLLAFDIWMLMGPALLVALGLWVLLARPARVGVEAIEGERLSIPLQGASRAKVSIRHGAGELNLSSGAAAAELLTGSFGGGVGHNSYLSGDVLRSELSGGSDRIMLPGRLGPWSEGLNWEVAFNDQIPLSLECRTGASESRFDLRELKVTEFDLRCGASEVTLWLPEAAGHSRINIRGGMGAIKIHVPEKVAARFSISSGMSDVNIDQDRFPRRGSVHESPDFTSAANKVEVRLRTGMSSVEIR